MYRMIRLVLLCRLQIWRELEIVEVWQIVLTDLRLTKRNAIDWASVPTRYIYLQVEIHREGYGGRTFLAVHLFHLQRGRVSR